MKVLSFHRTDLSRQVMDNILKSKSEFNCSHISRLTLEQNEEDTETLLLLRREQSIENCKKLGIGVLTDFCLPLHFKFL